MDGEDGVGGVEGGGELGLDFGGFLRGAGEGEEGGAGAGQVDGLADRGGSFFSERGEPGGDFVGGGREVVEEQFVELLGAGTGEKFPVGFFGVGVAVAGVEGLEDFLRGAALIGDDEDGEQGVGERERIDNFAAAGAQRRAGVNEEGDVGAELCGQRKGLFVVVGEVPELGEGEKRGGGVGGSAAESAAGGELFVERDFGVGFDPGVLCEEGGGFGDEVFGGVGGDVLGASSDFEFEGGGGREGEGIVEIERNEPRFDVVEAVRTNRRNAQSEVEFGGGVDLELVVGESGDAGG